MTEADTEVKELADRFGNYSDAVVAVSLVNVLGFFFAIAEEEIRCTLADHIIGIVIGGVLIQLAYMAALIVLRRGEQRLRLGLSAGTSPVVALYRQRLSKARFILVALATLVFAVLGPYGLGGPAC